jgi:LysR family transcriptional regulator, regulator for bpeEF and oprC
VKSLPNIQAFVQVAKHKSFSGAAAELGVSPSAISKSVQRLEDDLNLKLLHRTTRKLSLTDDGERFFLRASDILDELGYLQSEVTDSKGELNGRLRLNFPSTLGRNVMVSPVADFLQRHPKLKIEVRFDDRIIDLAEESVDVSVRTGQLKDSSNLIVTSFFNYQTILCAAPGYLRKIGHPRTVEDLATASTLGFSIRSSRQARIWHLRVRGDLVTIPTQHRLVFEDLTAVAEAAANGAGIALLPSWSCYSFLEAGRLVEILPELRPEVTPVWLAYHDRRHPSAKILSFVEEMKTRSKELTSRYTLLDS